MTVLPRAAVAVAAILAAPGVTTWATSARLRSLAIADELWRGSPTSLRQGYGGPPELQRRRKREGAEAAGNIPDQIPGIQLPMVQEHRYRLKGRVRPLLAFWIGKDNVGSARIRWRRGESATAYELVIGSDPDRAPSRLNRWGYLAEEVRGGESLVLGLMSKTDEQSVSDAQTGLKQTGSVPQYETLRGSVGARSAQAQVVTVRPAGDLTYHDAHAAIDLLLSTPSAAPIRQIARPAEARPGFLTAVAELVHRTIATYTRGDRLSPIQLSYVYGHRLYDLRLRNVEPLSRFEVGGRAYERVLRARFEARRQEGGQISRFELVYATSGPLAGVPVLISYRPRWWLDLELRIET